MKRFVPLHEIQNDHFRALIAPEAGGTVMGLECQGRIILRPAPGIEAVIADPREASCFSCVPWFGRLFGGLEFGARHYDLKPTLPACDPQHALHGEGWITPWTITAETPISVNLRFDYAPQMDKFPFPFRAEQLFRLGEAFEIEISLTNTHDARLPAGLGLHPFFQRRKNTRLRLSADRIWAPAPTGGGAFLAPRAEGYDFTEPAPLSAAVDHTYADWTGGADIMNGNETITIRSNAPHLHIYAPENENYFCLEPVTHLPGSFGADTLRPGETMSIVCRISVS